MNIVNDKNQIFRVVGLGILIIWMSGTHMAYADLPSGDDDHLIPVSIGNLQPSGIDQHPNYDQQENFTDENGTHSSTGTYAYILNQYRLIHRTFFDAGTNAVASQDFEYSQDILGRVYISKQITSKWYNKTETLEYSMGLLNRHLTKKTYHQDDYYTFITDYDWAGNLLRYEQQRSGVRVQDQNGVWHNTIESIVSDYVTPLFGATYLSQLTNSVSGIVIHYNPNGSISSQNTPAFIPKKMYVTYWDDYSFGNEASRSKEDAYTWLYGQYLQTSEVWYDNDFWDGSSAYTESYYEWSKVGQGAPYKSKVTHKNGDRVTSVTEISAGGDIHKIEYAENWGDSDYYMREVTDTQGYTEVNEYGKDPSGNLYKMRNITVYWLDYNRPRFTSENSPDFQYYQYHDSMTYHITTVYESSWNYFGDSSGPFYIARETSSWYDPPPGDYDTNVNEYAMVNGQRTCIKSTFSSRGQFSSSDNYTKVTKYLSATKYRVSESVPFLVQYNNTGPFQQVLKTEVREYTKKANGTYYLSKYIDFEGITISYKEDGSVLTQVLPKDLPKTVSYQVVGYSWYGDKYYSYNGLESAFVNGQYQAQNSLTGQILQLAASALDRAYAAQYAKNSPPPPINPYQTPALYAYARAIINAQSRPDLKNSFGADPFNNSLNSSLASLSLSGILQNALSKSMSDLLKPVSFAWTVSYTSDALSKSSLLKGFNNTDDTTPSFTKGTTSAVHIEDTKVRQGELSVADIMDRGTVKASFDLSNNSDVDTHSANLKDMATPTPRGPNVALADINLVMSPNDSADDSKSKLSLLNDVQLNSRVALLGSLNSGSGSKEQNSSSSSMTMEAYLNGASPVSKSLDRLLKKNPSVSIDAMRVKFEADPLSLDKDDSSSFSSYQWEGDQYTFTAEKHLPVAAA